MQWRDEYLRPGISVICVASNRAETQGFVQRVLPYVEQLILVGSATVLKSIAPQPRLRIISDQGSVWAGAKLRSEQIRLAAKNADHGWILLLNPKEYFHESAFEYIRAELLQAGSKCLALPVVSRTDVELQIRGWRTGWNLYHAANGEISCAGLSLGAPSGMTICEPAKIYSSCELLERQEDYQPIEPPLSYPGGDGPVFMAGMHRSGSSALARVVNLLGIDLGDNLLGVHTEALRSNPRGHWESLLGIRANQTILREAIGYQTSLEWLHPTIVPANQLAEPTIVALSEAMAAFQAAGTPWGMKDPRLSLTLPVWWSLIDDGSLLVSVRDPISVAKSMARRDGTPQVDGVRLWRLYYQAVLQNISLTQAPTLFVN